MLTKIDPKSITLNPFASIGEQWMLITAGTKENCNTMTASWGGLGIMWGLPVATAYIRPQRHTHAFVEEQNYFTLCFFPEEQRSNLAYCGRVSGRDEDKIAHCGFTVTEAECGAPYFAEAELVLVCRKVYCQSMTPDCFTDPSLNGKWYPKKDYHDMYLGEIVEAYRNC